MTHFNKITLITVMYDHYDFKQRIVQKSYKSPTYLQNKLTRNSIVTALQFEAYTRSQKWQS